MHPPDGPYTFPNETAFLDWIFTHPGGMYVGLVVGDTPADPWAGTYVMHWRAPSGWRGMVDGPYTVQCVANFTHYVPPEKT